MKIRTFTLLPFEEWNKTRKYTEKIGSYTCTIRTFAKSCNGNNDDCYMASVKDTTYVSSAIFEENIICNQSDEKKLEQWYRDVTTKLNKAWKKFILETYLLDDVVQENKA